MGVMRVLPAGAVQGAAGSDLRPLTRRAQASLPTPRTARMAGWPGSASPPRDLEPRVGLMASQTSLMAAYERSSAFRGRFLLGLFPWLSGP